MKRQQASSLASLVQSFFNEHLVEQRRASPRTVAAYRDGLRLLLVFAAEARGVPPSELRVADLDRETVLTFLGHLETQRGNSVRTRNARLAALKAFFRHVAYRDPGSLGIAERVLTVPGKRSDKAAIRCLTPDELKELLAVPDRSTAGGRRWYALLLFLARTGARVSEMIGVSTSDLHLVPPRQVRLFGKGSKERIVPLEKETATVLDGLSRGTPDSRGAPVFTNARGTRLSRHGAAHVLQSATEKAAKTCASLRGRRVSPHVLRHTLAMQLLRAGIDIVVIQNWLGHAHVGTTHAYVEADTEMKRRALERAEVISPQPIAYRPEDAILQLLDSI